MRNVIKKISKITIFRMIYLSLGIVLALTIATIYAAAPPNLPTVGSGQMLTSNLWNDMTDGINNHENNIVNHENRITSLNNRTTELESCAGNEFHRDDGACRTAAQIITDGGGVFTPPHRHPIRSNFVLTRIGVYGNNAVWVYYHGSGCGNECYIRMSDLHDFGCFALPCGGD